MECKQLRMLILIIGFIAILRSEPWKPAVNASVTLTQNAYSDNWAGSETGSITWVANMNTRFEKQLSYRFHNQNELRLAYGQSYSQDVETNEWSDPITSTDLIDVESIMRITSVAFVDPYTSARAETQFYDDADTTNKRWINPVLFTESVGVAKVFVKDDAKEITSRFGVAMRQDLDRDVMDPLWLEPRTILTNDAGLVLYADARYPLVSEQLTYTGKVSVYKALYFSEAGEYQGQPNENHWKYPDVNWENTLIAHVTSIIDVNLYTQILYDREIAQGIRFKETLSLGIAIALP